MKVKISIINLILLFCLTTFLFATDQLIFWNKLGSNTEVSNSEVGVDGVIVGTPNYSTVHFNNGVGNFPSESTHIKFDDLFSTNNYSEFTIEFWFKWNSTGTADYSVISGSQSSSAWGNTNWYILINGEGPGTCSINVVFVFNAIDYILYGWNATFNIGDIDHLAVTVDLSKTDGERIKLYRNGVDLGNPDWANVNTNPHSTYKFPSYTRIGQSTFNSWLLTSYADNLKIYNYTKTDFSDRFTEGDTNTAPTISIIEPNGIGDTTDTSYTITWNDSDPDNNAQISLYYDTDNTGNNGILIINGLSEDSDGANGSYIWDTSGIPNGSYYIYAKIDDGIASAVYDYSSGQVTISHATVSTGNLIFWNKLEPNPENPDISISEIGPNGQVSGTLTFNTCKFNYGVDNCNMTDNIIFMNAFTATQKGTVEFWWKPHYNPTTSSFHSLLECHEGAYAQLFDVYWCRNNGTFNVRFWGGTHAVSSLYLFNVSFNYDDLIHVGIVYDSSLGINNKIKLYLNGVSQPIEPTNVSFVDNPWDFDTSNIYINGTWDGSTTAIIDNLKIYKYCKTDFSDRFTEGVTGTNTNPPIVKPEPPVNLKATAGKTVVNLNWGISSSLNVQYYNVYRSILSGFDICTNTYIGQITTDNHTYHDRNVQEDTIYYYMITAVSSDDIESEPSNEAWARPGTKQHNLLLLNNKFNPNKGEKAKIKFKLIKQSKVKIKIINIAGTHVYEFYELYLPAAEYL